MVCLLEGTQWQNAGSRRIKGSFYLEALGELLILQQTNIALLMAFFQIIGVIWPRNPKARSIHFTPKFTLQRNNSRMNHCVHRLLVMPGLNPIFRALFYFVFEAESAEIYVEISCSP